jgi:hypothetical protein
MAQDFKLAIASGYSMHPIWIGSDFAVGAD